MNATLEVISWTRSCPMSSGMKMNRCVSASPFDQPCPVSRRARAAPSAWAYLLADDGPRRTRGHHRWTLKATPDRRRGPSGRCGCKAGDHLTRQQLSKPTRANMDGHIARLLDVSGPAVESGRVSRVVSTVIQPQSNPAHRSSCFFSVSVRQMTGHAELTMCPSSWHARTCATPALGRLWPR